MSIFLKDSEIRREHTSMKTKIYLFTIVAGARAPGAVVGVCAGQNGSATARGRATAAFTASGSGSDTRPAAFSHATAQSLSGNNRQPNLPMY